MKVVHVTPHMSGGLASVLLNAIKQQSKSESGVQHEIVCLDRLSDDQDVRNRFEEYSSKVIEKPSLEMLEQILAGADVVQLEWWNHPVIYDLLINFDLPRCRLVVVSHVSGLYRPQLLQEQVIRYADVFVATTKASKKQQIFKDNPALLRKVTFVNYPIDLDRFTYGTVRNTREFNVGYVGTVNYSKLHRDFLSICASIRISEAVFTVVGSDDVDNIEAESKRFESTCFRFEGYQTDVGEYLKTMDVFGYALKADHFGTGEQVILEAMFFGLPVVVFSNDAESEIIKHQCTGLVVDNAEEYVAAIVYLYRNPDERARLGANARKYVRDLSEGGAAMGVLDSVYKHLVAKPKKNRVYDDRKNRNETNGHSGRQGAALFIASLGNGSKEFQDSIQGSTAEVRKQADHSIANIEEGMKTRTKGSLYQYLWYYPTDNYLNYWAGLVKLRDNDYDRAKRYFAAATRGSDEVPTQLRERIKAIMSNVRV